MIVDPKVDAARAFLIAATEPGATATPCDRVAQLERVVILQQRSLDELSRAANEAWLELVSSTEDHPNLLARATERADALAATAAGYASLTTSDWTYPGLFEELAIHGWEPIPGADVRYSIEIPTAALSLPGDRRAWRRRGHLLQLWLTAPKTIVAGHSSHAELLVDERELRAVIRSSPDERVDRGSVVPARAWAGAGAFELSPDELQHEFLIHGWHMIAHPTRCTATGVDSALAPYRARSWHHPQDPQLKVRAWTVDGEFRVAYWAGQITDRAQLVRVLTRR